MSGHGDRAHVRAEETDTNNTLLKSDLGNVLARINPWARQVGLGTALESDLPYFQLHPSLCLWKSGCLLVSLVRQSLQCLATHFTHPKIGTVSDPLHSYGEIWCWGTNHIVAVMKGWH